jgi:hypothetical protein
MKTLTIFKVWSRKPSHNFCALARFPLSHWSVFFQCPPLIECRKRPYVRRVPLYFSVPLPGSRTRCHGQSLRFRASEEGYSEGLVELVSELIDDRSKASNHFKIKYRITTVSSLKIIETISPYTKSTDLDFLVFPKNIHLVTQSL